MKFNCKSGEIAIKVRASVGDSIPVGAVVKTIEHRTITHALTGEKIPAWLVEYSPPNIDPWRGTWSVRDEHLKPIRPDEGDDETLAWAGKPEGVAA